MKTWILVGLLCLSQAALAGDLPHWTYAGEEGPDHWAALCPEFGGCAGHNQSPINLTSFVESELKPIPYAYQPGGTDILNNGHTVQVNYAPGSSIVVDGITFTLKQFHFHAPSENLIEGQSFAMEGHLVHGDANGSLAVVSVMFVAGAENAGLAKLWPSLPAKAGDKLTLEKPFAVDDLLPADRDYYRFSGSLTTPPCTEGVRWLVLKKPVSISPAQVAAFTAVMPHPNNRPVQPINARVVLR